MITHGPIAVGGLGGSGTRVAAQILTRLGVKLSGPLNYALDSIWYALLFKRRAALVETDGEFNLLAELFFERLRGRRINVSEHRPLIEGFTRTPRQTTGADQIMEAARSFLADDQATPAAPGELVGWKEPNTHAVVERFLRFQPEFRYIHVMRHGVDMAIGGNQNQLRFWGPIFLERTDLSGPGDSLSFWRAVHQRIDRLERLYPGRLLTVKFEDLCLNTDAAVKMIAKFLDVNVNEQTLAEINDYCIAPPSIGRYRSASLDAFSPDDIEYVAAKGYALEQGSS